MKLFRLLLPGISSSLITLAIAQAPSTSAPPANPTPAPTASPAKEHQGVKPHHHHRHLTREEREARRERRREKQRELQNAGAKKTTPSEASKVSPTPPPQ